MEIYGGIEGGGTKFVCAVGTDPDNILDEIRFPTSTSRCFHKQGYFVLPSSLKCARM